MAETPNTSLPQTEFSEQSKEFRENLEKRKIDLTSTELDDKYDRGLHSLQEAIQENEYLETDEKQQLFEQAKFTLDTQLANLNFTLLQEQISGASEVQLRHFKKAVQLLNELTQSLDTSLDSASDRDISNWMKKGITDKEFSEVFQGQINRFYKNPQNQTLWNLEKAKQLGWRVETTIQPVSYVEIGSSENLRNPQTNEIIRKATKGERFQIAGDLPNKGYYEYKMVIDQNGDIFKLCVNDGNNVSQKTFELNPRQRSTDNKTSATPIKSDSTEVLEKSSSVVINSSENLRDPQTHEIVRLAQRNERFKIVSDLPPRGKYQYKLVESLSGEQFKLCVNDGDNVKVEEQIGVANESRDIPSTRGVELLVKNGFSTPNGELTDKVNPLQIHEFVNPAENQNVWIQIPNNIAIRQNLPKGSYLKASAVGNTFVYDDFPEFGQVRVKKGLRISLNQPADTELYSEKMNEPIPLDRSQLPTNPNELAEISKKCPVKVLYTESKGATGHPWGHTALEINGKVYSYGRWGKTDEIMGTTGEGALFVFDSFENYNKAEGGNVKRAPLFGVSAPQRQKMEQFFLSKIQEGATIDGHRAKQEINGEEQTLKTNYAGAFEYIIDNYNVFDQNCTTITLNALEAGGGELKDTIKGINLESKTFEDVHDARAIIGAIGETLDDLNISLSANLIEGFKQYINTGKIDPRLLPVEDDGTIINTNTQFDGKNLMDIFYVHLSQQYGTKNVRLPRNLYQALNSSDSKVASLNLQKDVQVAYAQVGEKKKTNAV